MDPGILEASTAAIVIAVAVAAAVLVVLLLLRRRKPGQGEAKRLEPSPEGEAAKRVPASKEVFAPTPPKAAVAAEEDLPEELREGDDDDELREEEDDDADAEPAAREREQAARREAERAAAEKKQAEAAQKAKSEAAKKQAEAKAKAEAEQKAKTKAEAEEKVKAEASAEVEVEAEAPAEVEVEAEPKTLRDGLGRTRKEGFIARLGGLFAGKNIDQELIDAIEEVLFTADIGVRTADRLLDSVRESLSKKELKDEAKVWSVLHDAASRILGAATANQKAAAPKPGEPYVTMVLGVNGSGKTTSIGKLAHQLVGQGQKVTLIAGDTFRAAAAEQIEHWARRVNADVFRGKEGADPASVVFDGVRSAVEKQADHVLVDTAGRLHTQVNLMEELKKVRRVMGSAIPGAPHRVLMVLDATTGQNAINQAKLFKEATDVTGIVLTKLDGTAKGGVVLGVCAELGIPIDYIGIGERVADLRAFDPNEFVDELFRPPSA